MSTFERTLDGALGTIGVATTGLGISGAVRAGGTAIISRGAGSLADDAIAPSGSRFLRLPTIDKSLAGTGVLGYTTHNGTVFIQPGLSRFIQLDTLRHESVHAFLSVGDDALLASFRQNVGYAGYKYSHVLRFIEEALAEGYATRSITAGLRFPLRNNYVTYAGLTAEISALLGLGYLLGSGD